MTTSSKKNIACVSEVSIPADTAWKITNDASAVLEQAALRLVVDGGDLPPGGRQDGVTDMRSRVINLATDDDLDRAPALLAPIARFGKLSVVDRDEIESYRSVHALLGEYLSPNHSSKKPLALAVFGPPGSGKSFGIKQVIESVANTRDFIEFNLAQLSSAEQLNSAFLELVNEGAKGGSPPFCFFDEFDCRLNGDELGWLRFFLAPLQDGEFFYQGKRQTIGKSVFVFAGGTGTTYRNFAREEEISDEDRARFVQAKGPDFVSRLSAHIDVLGVNRREDIPDQSYVLRRAVIIRGELESRELIGRTGKSLVDRVFLRKLLKVGRYKHGARSLQKIMSMCIGERGQLYLPPIDQLSMHVNKTDAVELTC